MLHVYKDICNTSVYPTYVQKYMCNTCIGYTHVLHMYITCDTPKTSYMQYTGGTLGHIFGKFKSNQIFFTVNQIKSIGFINIFK